MMESAARRASLTGSGIALVLLSLVSCAYYNTFYLAKKNFNAAEASVARSQTDKLPSDAEQDYDVALVQCRKLIERHPNSRWVDDAIYMMAACYYGKGDYDSATVRLDALLRLFPKTDLKPDALYLSGMCQMKQRNYEQGEKLFDEVLKDYPKFPKMDEIYFTRAAAAAARGDTPAAIEAYEAVARRFPDSRRADDSLSRIGSIEFDAGHYDSASVFFSRLLARVHDDHKRAQTAVQQAETLLRLDRPEDALALIDRVIPKNLTNSPQGMLEGSSDPTAISPDDIAQLRLQQAAALNTEKRYDDALATLRDIVIRYSTSNYAVEAQFQIGYTYETLMDSLDAARTAYEKAQQLPGRSVFKDQAMSRAESLKTLANLQKRAAKGDAAVEERAAADLRIAEMDLFDRNLVDTAVVKYRKIESDYPQTRAAPRAAYALAYIRWKKQADSVGAVQDFRGLVARYPASTQARSAIARLTEFKADTSGLHGLLRAVTAETTLVAADTTAARPDSSAARADSLSRIDRFPAAPPRPGRRGAAGPPDTVRNRGIDRIPPPPPFIPRPPPPGAPGSNTRREK